MIAKHLCASDAIDELVLADIDADLTKRIATDLRSEKVRALGLDAGDPAALRKAMDGCGLVVNAAIPRFNEGIKKAARDAGAHYIDLACESTDPYADDPEWKARDLTAILGMGEDPGMGNVFARHAADGMDVVESVRVRDGDTAASAEHPFIALFSPETFIEETLAASKIWKDGAYAAVPPFGARETYEFPPPVGSLAVYSVDHEEVDSLPRFIGKGVRYVDFKLALDDGTVGILKLFRDLRLLEKGPPGGPSPRKALLSVLPKPADLAGRVEGYAALCVEVAGEKDGVRKVHTVFTVLGHREAFEKHGATGTAYLTGTPAAVAAILLARGAIRRRGALAPELLDPEPFFPMLRERGIAVRERVTWEKDLG